MNKTFIKTSILFLIIVLTACSYKPIFSEKNYGFEIEEINTAGENKINRIIVDKLKFIKSTDEKTKRRYTIEIISTKIRKILSKDSKGDPLKFEMNVLVEYKILNNGKLLITNMIEKNNVYNNEADQFNLEQTEDIILENLAENISDILVSSIINLDDN